MKRQKNASVLGEMLTCSACFDITESSTETFITRAYVVPYTIDTVSVATERVRDTFINIDIANGSTESIVTRTDIVF